MSSPENYELFADRLVRAQSRVFGYVVSLLPNRDEAEEVFQETCLTLWKAWKAYDPERDFMLWACGVAKNKVREHLRHRQRHGLRFDDELIGQLADRRLALRDSLDTRAGALSDCLRKLKESQRQLVERCYTGAQKINSIAAEMKITPAALTMRLQRIRGLLFECVGKASAQEEA